MCEARSALKGPGFRDLEAPLLPLGQSFAVDIPRSVQYGICG